MHRVTVTRGFTIGGTKVHANTPYLMSNVLTGELLKSDAMVDGAPFYTKVMARWEPNRPPMHGSGPQTIWLLRTGGYGDLLMMTPGIRRLLDDGHEVNVVCDPRYACIFDGWNNPRLRVCDDPLPADLVDDDHAIVCFEGIIEGSEKARRVHGVDLFAGWMGVSVSEHRLTYHVLNTEDHWAWEKCPFAGIRRRVGIQVKSSSLVRSYEPNQLSRVIEILQKRRGIEIFLFGTPGDVECDIKGVRNLAQENLTFRQSCAVLATCDVVLAPDSALAHVAQALGIPCVLLFGSFPAGLRVTGNPAITTVLDAKSECGPCFHHFASRQKWPVGAPCGMAGFCTTLASIAPEKVAAAVVNLLTPHGGHDRGLQEPDIGRADCRAGEPAEAV